MADTDTRFLYRRNKGERQTKMLRTRGTERYTKTALPTQVESICRKEQIQ